MKSSMMNVMFATAALMVASTVAAAADMKVEVPFNFVAAGKMLPSGTYYVNSSIDERSFIIRNVEKHESVTLLSQAGADPKKEWRDLKGGVLQFGCSDKCRLQRIWTHSSYPAHDVQGSKPGHGERIAVIRAALK